MEKNITLIKGDGIGPEIVSEACKVLNQVAKIYHHQFHYQEILAGGCAIDAYGTPLRKADLDLCIESDSVLLGAVGGPKWDHPDASIRPEQALLAIRKGMGLYANLRPASILPQLAHTSPLRKSIVAKGIDFIVVRELISGVYFGQHNTYIQNHERVAEDQMLYHEHEIRRIAHTAFQTARKRSKHVISVDKANVLDTSRLWRSIVQEVSEAYPDVQLSNMLVDNCAMQIVKDPSQFDVIVTENMFGDILSDEASMITGSIGLIPSASLGDGSNGLYEPIHGSAPDIAGQNIANPIGTILAAAMMLKYSFDMNLESNAIIQAVNATLSEGYRSADIMEDEAKLLSCSQMGDQIASHIRT